MPIGLRNVRATFQVPMNSIFHELIDGLIGIHFADALIFSAKKEEYLQFFFPYSRDYRNMSVLPDNKCRCLW